MKICFIAPPPLDLSEKYAGTTHVIELANNLSKLGHEVFLFSRGLDKDEIKEIKFNYINTPSIPFKRIEAVFTFPLFTAIKMIKYNHKYKFDVIYQRHGSYVGHVLFEKLINVPVITEFNDLAEPESIEVLSNSIHRKIMKFIKMVLSDYQKFLVKKTMEYSAGFRTVTENIKKDLQRKYNIEGEKINVIGNGANTELFTPSDNLKCRKLLNLPENENIICFVGTFYPWQGLEYLISSAPMILKNIPNTILLIVGDQESVDEGGLKRKLIGMINELNLEEKIVFTGVVPYEEVPKYINASDVCVSPFIRERNMRIGLSPLKIYEYAACGKPIVSSRIPNLEFIEENNAGILVEPENPEELAKAVIRLLKDEKLREKMGRNGREYVVKNHSWESVARKVAEVCESAIREHKNKRR